MRFFIFILSSSLVLSALAEEETFVNKAIREGNWSLGLSGRMAYDSQTGLNGFLSTEAQKFFSDRLSFGFIWQGYKDRYIEMYSVGVIGTYYFYEMEKSAFYISQSLAYGEAHVSILDQSSDRDFLSATTTLGYNYFLNPYVAVGPRLQYEINPVRNFGGVNSLNLGIGLSVFY
ncbi:hypothetical protein K2X05_06870 [bacterium]|nr:hypothetical protein [bacterium]